MTTPAPDSARLVADFVNTFDQEEGMDELATPEQLGGWFRERGLVGSAVRTHAADVSRAAALRETLRELLLTNNLGGEGTGDLSSLNRCIDRSCVRFELRFDGVQCVLAPLAEGFDAALAHIVRAVSQLVADGSWARLKACGEESCRWVFYDQSRNRAGHWCTMRTCGNRAKARQFRARKRGEAASDIR